jgi:hypothetical protein
VRLRRAVEQVATIDDEAKDINDLLADERGWKSPLAPDRPSVLRDPLR